jgi:DNA-binding GntR family transcriptional regulator
MAELRFALDRSSPVPLYHQLAAELEAAIERGDLAHGQRLGNEADLAIDLGVSRPTIRRALQSLVDKGLLVRKRGVGTQIVQPQVRRTVRLSSLYDDLAASEQEPATQVLLLRVAAASAEVAAQLRLAERTEVVHLERLRSARGRPLALMRNWMPVEVAGELGVEQLESSGLYRLLRAGGVRPRVAAQRIGAKAADAREARLLGVRGGAPLVSSQRTTYDDDGRAFEYAAHLYRADAYAFEVTLVER